MKTVASRRLQAELEAEKHRKELAKVRAKRAKKVLKEFQFKKKAVG